MLKSVPFVKLRSDDILVSGKDDEEHLETLESVLKIIFENGLKLKLRKCVFMQPEVTYLGYRVNKDGIFPLPEKVEFLISFSTVGIIESGLLVLQVIFKPIIACSKMTPKFHFGWDSL